MNVSEQLARAAMTAGETAEYDQLSKTVRRTFVPIEARLTILTLVATAIVTAAATVTILTLGPESVDPIPWFVAWTMAFLGGLIVTAVVGSRKRKVMRLRMSEIRETATQRGRDARGRAASHYDNDGVDFGRYPVTATYDPQLYYSRGGRATANAMSAWGVDYETYRTNIE